MHLLALKVGVVVNAVKFDRNGYVFRQLLHVSPANSPQPNLSIVNTSVDMLVQVHWAAATSLEQESMTHHGSGHLAQVNAVALLKLRCAMLRHALHEPVSSHVIGTAR
jgi:hypothetical protein